MKFHRTLDCISGNIETLRKGANLSVRALSKNSGVGLATVCDIKNAKISDLKLSTLFKLAESLNVNLEFLLVDSNLKLQSKDLEDFAKAIKILNTILERQNSSKNK